MKRHYVNLRIRRSHFTQSGGGSKVHRGQNLSPRILILETRNLVGKYIFIFQKHKSVVKTDQHQYFGLQSQK